MYVNKTKTEFDFNQKFYLIKQHVIPQLTVDYCVHIYVQQFNEQKMYINNLHFRNNIVNFFVYFWFANKIVPNKATAEIREIEIYFREIDLWATINQWIGWVNDSMIQKSSMTH